MTLLVTDHDRDEQNLVSPNFVDDDGGHNQTMSNFLQKIRQASLDVRATFGRQKSVTDDCVDDYEELTTVDTNDDDDDDDDKDDTVDAEEEEEDTKRPPTLPELGARRSSAENTISRN